MTEMHPAKIPTNSPSNTSETENPWGFSSKLFICFKIIPSFSFHIHIEFYFTTNYDIMGKDFKKEVEKCRQLRMTGQIIKRRITKSHIIGNYTKKLWMNITLS